MKLDVPFYTAETDMQCGPVALKMVLAYLGEEHSMKELAKLEKQLDNGTVWSWGIVRAARKLGFKVNFISLGNLDHEKPTLDWYKNQEEGVKVLDKLEKESKKLGSEVQKKNLSLEELLKTVTKDTIPIVLLDWSIITKKEKFVGHFVPITGYDDQYVYVHDYGPERPQPYLKLENQTFLKAWESKGTAKDAIIVYRKGQNILP